MSKDTPLRLAVDFDDTIMDTQNVPKGYKLGQPVEGAPEALQGLKKEGAIIVIHSVWADTEQKCEAMAKWCQYFHVPYDFITSQKPDADCYLDNRGIRFTSWSQALKDIKRFT